MRELFTRFVRDESGANVIEYSLIAALAPVAVVVILESFGVSLQKFYDFAGIFLAVLLMTGSLALAAFLYARVNEKSCRWRRLRARDRPPFKGWVCRSCGEEAYAQGWRPPKECKRALGNAL